MKNAICYLLFLSFGLVNSCSRTDKQLPNIVMIVADDMGWRDLGFMGSDYYETPNIDKLASEAKVFMQAYSAASNCAPSRACLMSGRYTPVHGIYTVGSSERGNSKIRRIIPAINTTVLAPEFISLAESLQELGYITCNIGKWHLGMDPISQGMNENIGGGIWGHPGSYFAPYGQPELPAPEGEYLTDRLTHEATQFMRRHSDHPFFLYLPYYAVHTPLQAKVTLEQKYLDKGSVTCQNNVKYAGMVDNMDRCIGLIINELSLLGLSENTLVIFTSDNGGIRKVSCQDPLRAGKGSYYEGGIRVPLIFRFPERIKPGKIDNVPVINLDFYPTILGMIQKCTGVDLSMGEKAPELDGISLWPLLTDGDIPPDRPLYFHFPVYLQAYSPGDDDGRDPLFRTRPGSVIIDAPWKLHYYYEDNGIELYNLEEDPGERKNLAASELTKSKEMVAQLQKWLLANAAPQSFDQNPLFDSIFESQMISGISD
ncbi:MAG: sulfatase [Bacteroides sp.]|nr:sulfatase [Bacteroides sp.]